MTKKTKLAIFDFDGTLIRNPEPHDAKLIYKEKTGKDWPHVGYWSKPESLDMEIFNLPIIKDTVLDYTKEIANESTVVVLLTGRLERMADLVKKVLFSHSLVFDEYEFNTGGRTEICKMKSMDKLLNKYPDVTELECWDDRLEHIPIFEEWGKNHCLSGRLKGFNINVIINS